MSNTKIMFSGLMLLAMASWAPESYSDGCRGGPSGSGYVYLRTTCQKSDWRKQGTPCRLKEGESTGLAAIYSNVISGDLTKPPYPTGKFYNATENQLGDSMNGTESICYKTRSEAEDALDEDIADSRRHGFEIFTVRLRD